MTLAAGLGVAEMPRADAAVPTAVSGGAYHTCGIKTDGSLVCWGGNQYGQLNGVPTGTTFSSVDSGKHHTCGLKSDGTVACWGLNGDGQVSGVPAGVVFSSVSVGAFHNCGLKSDGTLACWGWDDDGEVSGVPAGTTFRSVSAGSVHTCGVKTDGTLACWGRDRIGPSYGGWLISGVPAGVVFSSVSAGDYYTCGLKPDGTVTCWGANEWGQASGVPAGAKFSSVSAGSDHTCGIKTDGTVACWGDNSHGQVSGVPAGVTFSSVSAGYSHTCGVTTNASVVCWGDNTYGQTNVPAGAFPGNDTAAPTTSITLRPTSPNGQNGWYTSSVGVSITADDGDGSGVASTRCALDLPTAPAMFDDLPSGPCSVTSVSNDGQHTIYAASVDAAGSKESPVSATIKLDATAPSLSPTLSPATVYLNQTGATAAPNATDATSGVATSGCGAVDATTAGDHTVTCTATDNAGNRSTVTVHYTVQYNMVGFLSPVPNSKWKVGQTVPIKVALLDASGTRISDGEAGALASDCRVRFSAAGVQNQAAQCLKYDTSNHQFIYNWMLAKRPTGVETISVTVSYSGTTTTTTKSQAITITN